MNILFNVEINLKSTDEVMMFGWGGASLLPSNKKKLDQRCKKGGFMKLFTPFTIPKKENCDLCRIKRKNNKRANNLSFLLLLLLLYLVSFSLGKRVAYM